MGRFSVCFETVKGAEMTEHKAKTISNSPSPYKVYDEAYNKGMADERAKINDELSEVQQILILYDVDTAEKRREIIDLLEQIKSHK